MSDTCAIDLRVRLPRSLADELERVKEQEPEVLNRILAYGVTRRAIFDHLMARGGVAARGGPLAPGVHGGTAAS